MARLEVTETALSLSPSTSGGVLCCVSGSCLQGECMPAATLGQGLWQLGLVCFFCLHLTMVCKSRYPALV